jgi:hypothetical protein
MIRWEEAALGQGRRHHSHYIWLMRRSSRVGLGAWGRWEGVKSKYDAGAGWEAEVENVQPSDLRPLAQIQNAHLIRKNV